MEFKAKQRKRHFIDVGLMALLLCFTSLVSAETKTPPETAAIKVKVITLDQLAFYPQRSAPAQVVSLNEPVISAEIAARVTALSVRVGDVVEAGAELATLDCRNYQLAGRIAGGTVRALDARKKLAKQRVTRVLELEDKQLVSTDLLEERQADLTALQAEHGSASASLQRAKLDESRCVVISPFKALVTERMSSVGQYATLGSALVKLIDLQQLEVSAQVSSQNAARLDAVQSFTFEHNDQPMALNLRHVLPALDANTRNRAVRLEFADKKALPGASGKLLWRDARPHLPAEVWVKREGQLGVFVLSNERAQFIAVSSARMGRANVVNLPNNTQIIIEGHYALQHNQRVQVID
ncbi:MAG: efflux RND transporter periplasmic adaptor subunit [Pseudomonadales bacterium]